MVKFASSHLRSNYAEISPEWIKTCFATPSDDHVIDDSYLAMMTLAAQIHRELERGERYIICEFELSRIWPLNEKDREAKITQFAQEHGLRLRFYRIGWCAIFDKPTVKLHGHLRKSASFSGSR
jgi:hypothetical protein